MRVETLPLAVSRGPHRLYGEFISGSGTPILLVGVGPTNRAGTRTVPRTRLATSTRSSPPPVLGSAPTTSCWWRTTQLARPRSTGHWITPTGSPGVLGAERRSSWNRPEPPATATRNAPLRAARADH